MSACTYDNPATMSRECWQDGRLMAAYTLDAMMGGDWPPPARRCHMGANIGEWKAGRIVGDADAIGPVNRP